MLYEKIKTLCEQNQTSIYQLECELGFSVGCIRKWENSIPSADKLVKVARRFSTTVEELLAD